MAHLAGQDVEKNARRPQTLEPSGSVALEGSEASDPASEMRSEEYVHVNDRTGLRFVQERKRRQPITNLEIKVR